MTDKLLPIGTYCVGVLLIGDPAQTHGQTAQILQPAVFEPSDLLRIIMRDPAVFVPDSAAGAHAGWFWLFQIIVKDVWGRLALHQDHCPIDRSLDQDELAGEIARAAPEIYGRMVARLVDQIGITPTPQAERPQLLN